MRASALRLTTPLVVGLVVFAAAGCTYQSTPEAPPPTQAVYSPPPDGLGDEATRAWSTWQASGVDDYHYVLSIRCFCPVVTNAKVTVVNGEVVVLDATKDERSFIRSVLTGPPTVESLFRKIAEAEQAADNVSLTFNDAAGVPTALNIDYADNGTDDELYIEVSKFGRGSWPLIN